MRTATSTRRLASLGAAALAMTAALLAFAICMPATASALDTREHVSGGLIYLIDKGETVTLDQHTSDRNLYIWIKGDATINGGVHTNGNVNIRTLTKGAEGTLTINGGISGANVLFGDGANDANNSTVIIKGTSKAIVATGHITFNSGTVKASSSDGIYANDYITIHGANVTVKTTKKSASVMGAYCSTDLTVEANGTLDATGYSTGIFCGDELTATDSTVIGRTTKTTTLSSSAYAYGINSNFTIDATNSTVKGYVYCGSKTFSKTNPHSVAIKAMGIANVVSDFYAYNKGKYGVGIKTSNFHGYCAGEDGTGERATVKAYAKNYGIGFLFNKYGNLLDDTCSFFGTDATIYGGKYAIYCDGGFFCTYFSKIYAAGKNLKGTSTGHGIYVKNNTILLNRETDLTVYAKNSSSYYGVYACQTDSSSQCYVACVDSTVNVYGYSGKAFRYKLKSSSTLKKGAVADGSTLKINGKKQTSYPSVFN